MIRMSDQLLAAPGGVSAALSESHRTLQSEAPVCHWRLCTVHVFLHVCTMEENRKQKEDVGDNGGKNEAVSYK